MGFRPRDKGDDELSALQPTPKASHGSALVKVGWLTLCCLVYTGAYIARANISSGFSMISGHYGVNDAYLGSLGSAFFIFYAFGQLINGYLGDRLSPRRFVAFSLVGSISAYALVLIIDHPIVLLVLWGVNGLFLSMLWGPMLRLLYMKFGERRRADVVTVMGAAPIAGYCVSWVFLAPAMPKLGWSAAFWIPLTLIGLCFVVWLIMLRWDKQSIAPEWSARRLSLLETLAFVRRNRLLGTMIPSLCLGLVKENIALLMPALFIGFLSRSPENASWQLLLLPMANLVGLVLSRILATPLIVRPNRSLAITFACMAGACGVLFAFPNQPGMAFIALFVVVALSYLCSCIVISYIPLSYAEDNMVSTLSGLFDFCNYAGAALSSVLLGALLAQGKWSLTALIWMGFCLAACLCTVIFQPKRAKQGA